LIVVIGLSIMSFGIPEQDHELHHVDLRGVTDGIHTGEYRIVPPFGTFVANKRVVVDVEVQDHSISGVELIEPEGMDTSFVELEKRVVREQSSAIDAVSGGTWTKRAYLKAIEQALAGTSGSE
jgi:uncharacterized protein with FMN-binding domain